MNRIQARWFNSSIIHYKFFTPENLFSPLNKIKFQECSKIDHRWTYGSDNLIKTKQAAVLVPLCIANPNIENNIMDPSCCIMFIKRTRIVLRNSGDISFPGGIFEMDKDKSLRDTALRETLEEVGLDPSRVDLWNELNPFPSRDLRTTVTPYIGFVSKGVLNKSQLKLSEKEVEEILFVPIRDLCNLGNIQHTQYNIIGKRTYSLPIYFINQNKPTIICNKKNSKSLAQFDQLRIWGLTAIILHHVLKLLIPENIYNYKIPVIPLQIQ